MQKRTYLEDAIAQLTAGAHRCKKCDRPFVYGRKGAMFCSENCAKAMAQRAYRKRVVTG